MHHLYLQEINAPICLLYIKLPFAKQMGAVHVSPEYCLSVGCTSDGGVR